MAGAKAVEHFDVIVAGVGGMGSAACAHLAMRGKHVLGLERFDIPHAMGSSHGVSRIIRLAYYEDSGYVPLLLRAYELWRELESGFGERLLHVTGSIDASAADGEVFLGSLESCRVHDLDHEVLTSGALTARFPGYRLPADYLALWQPEGGFLLSERAIVAHALLAMAHSAEIRARERVLAWQTIAAGVRVETTKAVYEAERLVISAGAWMGDLVPALAGVARPERQVLGWFQPTAPPMFTPDHFPVFNLTVPEGRYYGFPVYGIPGFKVGRYHHLNEQIDPEEWDREPNDADEAILRDFIAAYFPVGNGPVMSMRSCIFTNTPDEHFIVDTLRGSDSVIVASPCSGHGFKFCSVMGEILADLATEGETRHDIRLFSLDRFGAPAPS
ncbi:MAG: N-methyl-L-tryptophan oxidase [Thermomicrobiales bacterium]